MRKLRLSLALFAIALGIAGCVTLIFTPVKVTADSYHPPGGGMGGGDVTAAGDNAFTGQNSFATPPSVPPTETLSSTTALLANKIYSGAIDTRTVTLSGPSTFPGSHIHFVGTAAGSTVITWPGTTVRQSASSSYASSTTFPAGNVEFDLYSDGTDWYLTVYGGSGNALTSGTLAQFAATTSAELDGVISDDTGSGALVFANSPTLVTPNLGTPSTIVLSAGSGLPISTGVSGLGTGIATALAVNTGSAGAPVLFNGAGGTPSSIVLTNATGFPGELGKLGVHGADIASASTINLETATGDVVDVTGTTGITTITLSEGHERWVRFTGTLTLTNGANLVLLGGGDVLTAAGNYSLFRGYASSVVREVAYSNADGAPRYVNTLTYPQNSGAVTLADMSVSSAASAATEESVKLNVDGNTIIKAYAESDGAGGLQNVKALVGLPQAAAGGTLTVSTTTTGNVGAGVDNLISYTVPAATLATNGGYLEWEAWGTFANNGNTKQLKLLFGATTVIDSTAIVLTNLDWRASGRIVRTGAATQTATSTLTIGGTLLGALTTSIADTTAPAETLSGTVVFKGTGEATADNDVVQNGLIIKWYPTK